MTFKKITYAFMFLLMGLTAFANKPGHPHHELIGSDVVYTKDDVDEMISDVVKTKRYPMFVVDLNETLVNYVGITNNEGCVTNFMQNEDNPYSHTTWCEFELKATTNNFLKKGEDLVASLQVTNSLGEVITNIAKRVNGIGNDQQMVFFSVTSLGLEFGGEYPDGRDKADPIESMRKYVNSYEANGKKTDGRSLTFYTSSMLDLTNPYPEKVVIILDPTKFKHTPDNSWCNNKNQNLNWVFLRGGLTHFERDFNGQYIWRSIKPVKWFDDLPDWAYTNGEVRVISEQEYKK